MSLYYLIYSSTPSRPLTDLQIQELLAQARKANLEHSVTGMLLCMKGMYLQLIEGEETVIRQLYKNLQRDSRHYQVEILKEGIIEKRFFPNWSMGFEMKDTEITSGSDSFDLFSEKSLSLLSMLEKEN